MDFLLIPFLGFLSFVVFMAFSKYGRGKALGGKIVWSGKEHLLDESSVGTKFIVQVHGVETKDQLQKNKVGIELRSKSFTHLSIRPVSLSIDQATELSEELNNAIKQVDT